MAELTEDRRQVNERLVLGALRSMERMDLLAERAAAGELRIEEQAQQHLADLRELQNANRLATVGSLVASIVHELGTPLAVIQVRAQMIAAGDVPADEILAEAAVIIEQTERMTRMVREVLELAQPHSPRMTSSAIDLHALACHAVSLLAPLARARHVKLDLVTTDEAPMMVLGYSSRLLQILSNLIINAVNAIASAGHVELRLERRRACPPRGLETDYLALDVTDDGAGMSVQVQQHLFQPFFTTRGDGGGTGLGLAVSSRIASEHGGFIGVVSEVDHGSRFTLYLPPMANPG